MTSLLNALREEIAAIVRREIKSALADGKATPSRGTPENKVRKPAKTGSSPRVAFPAKDLVALREKLSVSGPEYARLAGVSVATIYNWEKSKGQVNVRAETAASLSRLQGLTAEQARAELGPAKKRGRQPGAGKAAKAKSAPKAKAMKAGTESGPSVEVSSRDIDALRKKLAVSGPELARLIGVSVASIYNWEKSKQPVSLRSATGGSFLRVQGLTAESARAELGPAKKRGRQPKAKASAPAAAPSASPKPRGRPGRKPKVVAVEVSPAAEPKKRGRPGRKPKVAAAAPVEAPKKRGRPGRKPKAPVAAPAEAPKKRGRPGRKPKLTVAELPF